MGPPPSPAHMDVYSEHELQVFEDRLRTGGRCMQRLWGVDVEEINNGEVVESKKVEVG